MVGVVEADGEDLLDGSQGWPARRRGSSWHPLRSGDGTSCRGSWHRAVPGGADPPRGSGESCVASPKGNPNLYTMQDTGVSFRMPGGTIRTFRVMIANWEIWDVRLWSPSRSVAVPVAPGLDVRSSVSAVVGTHGSEPSGRLRRIDVRIVSQSASVIGAFTASSPSHTRGAARYPPRALPWDRLTKLRRRGLRSMERTTTRMNRESTARYSASLPFSGGA